MKRLVVLENEDSLRIEIQDNGKVKGKTFRKVDLSQPQNTWKDNIWSMALSIISAE